MKRLALLFLPAAAFAAAPVSDWSPNFTGSIAWHTNVTNGEADWDRIATLHVNGDVVASTARQISGFDSAHFTLHFGGDWYPRFSPLARGLLGGRADWRHSFGRDEFAPTFGVEAAGDYVAAKESARRGLAGALTLDVEKKFAAGWRVALRERFDQYAAKHGVFDASGNETSIDLGKDIGEATRLTFTARWRQGDVVTYAQYTRPDLVAVAHDFANFDTFRTPMTAYAADARTIGGRLALSHATSEESAMVVAYDYARTDRTGLRFANQVLTISFVRQY